MVDDWDEWPLLKKKAISHTIQIILMHLPKGKLCFLILWSNLLFIPPDMYTIFAFLKEKEWGKWWWNAFHKCQGFAGGKKGPDHYDHRSPEWWMHTECMRKITVRWLLSPAMMCHSDDGDLFTWDPYDDYDKCCWLSRGKRVLHSHPSWPTYGSAFHFP